MAFGAMNNVIKTMLMDQRTANPPFDNMELLIFTGALSPTQSTTMAAIEAVEQAGTGYARATITGWTTAVLSSNQAVSSADQITFTNSGGSPWTESTGWAWVYVPDNEWVIAGRFTAAWTLGAGLSYITMPVHFITGAA